MGQSLEEAIRITLKTNPDIQASAYSVKAAEQLKNQVRGSLLPSVDFVFSGGHEESNNTTTRALGEDGLDMTRVERSFRKLLNSFLMEIALGICFASKRHWLNLPLQDY